MDHRFELRGEWNSSEDMPHPQRGFTRHVTIQSEDAGELQGSSAKVFHGDASRWNPEQLVLAALVECHILSYLYVAAEAGLTVDRVSARGELTLTHDASGGQITKAVLRPEVWLHGTDVAQQRLARSLHATAHEQCFIARSVNFPVEVKPVLKRPTEQNFPQFTSRLGAPIQLRPVSQAKPASSVSGAENRPGAQPPKPEPEPDRPSGSTFYEQVGGHETFAKLARVFYEQVAADETFRAMYPEEDLGPAEERLRMFLEQYWGGPKTYQEQRGHPRLRMRHMPYEIGPTERDTWLKFMRTAVDSLNLSPLHEAELWDYLERAAHAMQNKA